MTSTFSPPPYLSPSSVKTFSDCQLKFRFGKIQKLPDPPSDASAKGNAVHDALEALLRLPAAERSRERAHQCLADVRAGWNTAMFDYWGFDPARVDTFWAECARLVDGYFQMEDPRTVLEPELELKVQTKLGRVPMLGFIDRVERSESGSLVITDYKSGKVPGERFAADHLTQLEYYAAMLHAERGELASSIRLYYIAHGKTIEGSPTEASTVQLIAKTEATFDAIERACSTGVFTTKTGPLCNYCAYQPWCPEFGGNPDRAADEVPLKYPANLR